MRAVFSILIAMGWSVVAQAATSVPGRIDLNGKPITLGPNDSDPVASPDGRSVVFLRHVAGKPIADCSATGDAIAPVELWEANGRAAHRLLALHGDSDVAKTVCAFDNVQFSFDGSRLYFETPAWATSGAIHVYEFKTGRERLFLPGNGLTVLARCRDARYRDDIIVSQHRYFVFSGSYDWSFLFTPAGKEVGPLGDGDFKTDLEDVCG